LGTPILLRLPAIISWRAPSSRLTAVSTGTSFAI